MNIDTMKDTTNATFRVRQYGHAELALAYCPHLVPHSAWRKLKGWLWKNPALREYFFLQTDLAGSRSFTPREVALIVEQLGEP